jgi:hypothetical protein
MQNLGGKRGSICALCGESNLFGRQRPEHPIPAAIGSSLKVPTVCDSCNTWASANVDEPFLRDDWVLIHRSIHDIRDTRHGRQRRIPSPMLSGFTKEGIHVTTDHEGHPHFGSKIIEAEEPGVFHIHAGSEADAARLLERLRKRAAAEGKALEVRDKRVSQVQPEITANVGINLIIWRRMAGKIALGVASLVYPEAWRMSADAITLRDWVRKPDLLGPDGLPLGLFPDRITDDAHLLRTFVDPPEHLLVFTSDSDGPTALAVVLFGELFFAVTVDSRRVFPVPNVAWRLDPRRPNAPGKSSRDQLFTRFIARKQGQGHSSLEEPRAFR